MTSITKWGIPLLIVFLLSPFLGNWDLASSNYFYSFLGTPGQFENNAFTLFIFKYGERIGFFIGSLCVLLFAGSFFYQRFIKVRLASLALILTLCLGPGLAINLILKEAWARPRPRQVIEFGGAHEFRPFYLPKKQSKQAPQKSFPSGHASMGFLYITLYFSGKRLKNRLMCLSGLIAGVGFGLILSLTRIAQGGHFLSDTLFSALIVWLTALFVDYLVFESKLFEKLRYIDNGGKFEEG